MVSEENILGLYLGLRTMRKVEKAKFLVTPEYGYLEMGCTPRIPASAKGLCS